MRNLKLKGLSFVIFSTLSTSVLANSGPDSRGFAMGGTGVASANYLAAGFYNPALVTNYKNNDDFGLILPSISIGANDPNDLYKKIDEFQVVSNKIESDESVTQDEWKNALKALDNGKIDIDVKAGGAISVPNKYLGVNLFSKAQLNMIATADIDDDVFELDPTLDDDILDELNSSTVTGLAGGTVDIGVALAKSFDLPYEGQSISVGISPKLQKLVTLRYQETPDGFDQNEFNATSDYKEKSTFNLDLGLAYVPLERITVALAAQNIIKQELKSNISSTGSSETYLVEPKYTAGIAYNDGFFTVAADIDLNKQRYFELEKFETQFARVGAEFNAWDWAQLRAGYSYSMTDYAKSKVTAGVGLKPFGVFGIDIAGQYGEGNNYGASLQFVLTI